MELIWTKEALDKLIEIQAYIAEDSPETAAKFINYLIEQAEKLKAHPQIGRIVPEMNDNFIRELIVKQYRIIYQLKKDKIVVLTVFEGHQLLKKASILENKKKTGIFKR